MGPLQLAVTWYKIRHAGEQATHWTSKTKKMQICLDEVALFWMSQWTACSPAWRILYHVTASCKGPILKLTAEVRSNIMHAQILLFFYDVVASYVWNFGLRRGTSSVVWCLLEKSWYFIGVYIISTV